MIVEAFIIGVTTIVVASLRFTDRIVHTPSKLRQKALAEKRRLIERERNEWLRSPPMSDNDRIGREKHLAQCNEMLLELADEEAFVGELDHE